MCIGTDSAAGFERISVCPQNATVIYMSISGEPTIIDIGKLAMLSRDTYRVIRFRAVIGKRGIGIAMVIGGQIPDQRSNELKVIGFVKHNMSMYMN